MNALVTGGAGFVGTNLIKKLLADGDSVTCVDNYNTGTRQNHIAGATYLDYDIRTIEDYTPFGKFDIVYHLAAIARIQPSFKIPYEYFTTNASATYLIAQYCCKYDIPLVYAGSSSHHSGKFKNPYTFSKAIGEEVIELHQQHYGLKASIARFYNVYGPYHLKDGGYSTVIGRWEKRVEEGLPLIIYGDGSKRRDFTHVDDIVDGLIRIVDKEAWGYVFELGRGLNYSILEVANMFHRDIVYEENKPGEAQETLCDYSVAERVLGWRATKRLEDYIQHYLHG